MKLATIVLGMAAAAVAAPIEAVRYIKRCPFITRAPY